MKQQYNMNKLILLVILSIRIVDGYAQSNSKWYLRTSFSYSKGSNQTLYLFDPLSHSEFNQDEYATPSLGEAILFNAGAGYRFTKNFAVESNFAYLNGLDVPLYSFNTSNYKVAANITNRQILFLPTTVFTIQLKKFNPYVKVGIMVPLYNQSSMTYKLSSSNGSREYEYDIKNQLNLGINGCVGLSYALSKHWEIFVEAEEDNIRSFHKEANMTKQSSQGNLSASVPSSNFTFVKQENLTNPQPNTALNFPISFNREAYILGFKYNF
jgi:opacity protein-like surface antigen